MGPKIQEKHVTISTLPTVTAVPTRVKLSLASYVQPLASLVLLVATDLRQALRSVMTALRIMGKAARVTVQARYQAGLA